MVVEYVLSINRCFASLSFPCRRVGEDAQLTNIDPAVSHAALTLIRDMIRLDVLPTALLAVYNST